MSRPEINRRKFLLGAVSLGALAAAAPITNKAKAFEMFGFGKDKEPKAPHGKAESFPFELTDEEWRERLTPEQYKVLRSEGTERSCSSPLIDVEGPGKFYCAGCGHLLFSTGSKFYSDSGWPSFYEPHDEYSVGTSTDYKIGYARTEVHCANCGGHLGHIFPDGPPPTGLRYCINGVALEYVQDEKTE